MAIPNQDFKICSKCKEIRPLSDYYRNGSGYLISECKKCTIKRSKIRSVKPEVRIKDNLALCQKRSKIRDEVFAAYGGYKCVCCGETEPSFMTLDHIDNDGADFRRKIAGKRTAAGYRTYIWLKKNSYPANIQVLCMNCNHGKRMNKGICPHKVRCNDHYVGTSVPKRTAPELTLVRGEDMVCSAMKVAAA